MTEEAFAVLKRLDALALEIIDRAKGAGRCDTYSDGFGQGLTQAGAEIRAFVERECLEFHQQVAAEGKAG
jgi:hypothetical protein